MFLIVYLSEPIYSCYHCLVYDQRTIKGASLDAGEAAVVLMLRAGQAL